jgi:long-chain fatty acid transport protein
MKRILIASALWLGVLGAGWAVAGGLLLYEVGTADLGLASAGWGARAQDASAVFTNPAGMTRLEGSQALLGVQALYGDYGFSIEPGTSASLGTGDGGNPIGWFPSGGAFFSYSASPDLKFGFAMTGNLGLSNKYDEDWVGRYHVQESTLLGVSHLPSTAYRVTDKFSLGGSLNIMYGILKNQVYDAWRFGAGVQNKVSKAFSWGAAAEYAYGGTLDVDRQSDVPVVLGGRGDLVGSYPDTGIFFLAANFNWIF